MSSGWILFKVVLHLSFFSIRFYKKYQRKAKKYYMFSKKSITFATS